MGRRSEVCCAPELSVGAWGLSRCDGWQQLMCLVSFAEDAGPLHLVARRGSYTQPLVWT